MNLELDKHQALVHMRVTWTNRHPQATPELVFNAHSHYQIPDDDVGYLGTNGKLDEVSAAMGITSLESMNEVIAGWTEGVQLMVEGQTMRFWIPEKLAYKGERPPYGTLVFDVELIKIQ